MNLIKRIPRSSASGLFITQIQVSKDYNLFDLIVGNRNLNISKVEKIINDIRNGLNLLPYCPIIAYKDEDCFRIIDGQHRFEVSKQLGFPVYYVLANELDLKQIALMNSRQDKWSQSDFLRCYVKIGIEDYVTLQTIMKDYSINVTVAASLLMIFNIGSKETNQLFRDGEFKINYLDEVTELLKLSHSLFDAYKFYTDRNLISAVQQLKKRGLCDFAHLKDKLTEAPMIMDKQASAKDYIFNIERVYNHKKKERQIIF